MKAGTSSLNPYAASYIPLSRREAADESKDCYLTAKDFKSRNESMLTGSHFDGPTKGQHESTSQIYNAQNTDILLGAEGSATKGHAVHGGSSSQHPNDITHKLTLADEYNIDLAYLQMTFPFLSDDSLSELYMANKGDLEATVDMLYQLELCNSDSSDTLPDTLDIGDVSVSAISADGMSLKLEVSGKAKKGSSSGCTGTAFSS